MWMAGEDPCRFDSDRRGADAPQGAPPGVARRNPRTATPHGLRHPSVAVRGPYARKMPNRTPMSTDPRRALMALLAPTPSSGGGGRRRRGLIAPPSGPAAPLAAYPVGTPGGVGSPTGTTYTATAGIPAEPDSVEMLTITHPITGEQSTRLYDVYENRSWAATLQFGVGGSDNPKWFRNPKFDRTEGDPFRCVDVTDSTLAQDIMAPVAVFERATFLGNGDTFQTILGDSVWLIRCHAEGAQDAAFLLNYSVADTCNFIVGSDDPEAHTDGMQMPGSFDMPGGTTAIFQCWTELDTGVNANSAIFVGADFSPVDDISIYYCGMTGGSFTLSLLGDMTNTVTSIKVVGCRFSGTFINGNVNINEFVTIDEWEDNALFNGTPVPQPTP